MKVTLEQILKPERRSLELQQALRQATPQDPVELVLDLIGPLVEAQEVAQAVDRALDFVEHQPYQPMRLSHLGHHRAYVINPTTLTQLLEIAARTMRADDAV